MKKKTKAQRTRDKVIPAFMKLSSADRSLAIVAARSQYGRNLWELPPEKQAIAVGGVELFRRGEKRGKDVKPTKSDLLRYHKRSGLKVIF